MGQDNAVEKILEVKDKIKFFNDLEDNEIKILLKNVHFKKFKQNEIIFSQGENKDNCIYYIMKGYVNILIKGTDGNTRKVATLNTSTLIGEMKPMLNEGRTATCIAGTMGAIVIGFEINHGSIDENTPGYAKFYRNMSFILAHKIQETNKRFK